MYAAIFEQLLNGRMCFCERLKLPASSAFNFDAHARERLSHLRRAVEVDVRRLVEKRKLRDACRKLAIVK